MVTLAYPCTHSGINSHGDVYVPPFFYVRCGVPLRIEMSGKRSPRKQPAHVRFFSPPFWRALDPIFVAWREGKEFPPYLLAIFTRGGGRRFATFHSAIRCNVNGGRDTLEICVRYFIMHISIHDPFPSLPWVLATLSKSPFFSSLMKSFCKEYPGRVFLPSWHVASPPLLSSSVVQ